MINFDREPGTSTNSTCRQKFYHRMKVLKTLYENNPYFSYLDVDKLIAEFKLPLKTKVVMCRVADEGAVLYGKVVTSPIYTWPDVKERFTELAIAKSLEDVTEGLNKVWDEVRKARGNSVRKQNQRNPRKNSNAQIIRKSPTFVRPEGLKASKPPSLADLLTTIKKV